MTTATLKIKRIVSVVDTRTYEEDPDDKFHPIPDSGTINQCDRCGRDHEVHATVEMTDGTSATVGTGCMKADSFDRKLRSAATTAKTIARLQCELNAAEAYTEARSRAAKRVMDLDVPAVTIESMPKSEGWFATTCGSESVFSQDWNRADERKEEVIQDWRARQINDICPIKYVAILSIRRRLAEANARLKKATK